MTTASKYLNGRQIRRGKQPKACCITTNGRVVNNPHTTEGLESTANGVPSGWIGLIPHGESEVRAEFTDPEADGAIELHYNKNRTACWFAAGTLLAEFPFLAVEKGYQRQLAWRVEPAAMGEKGTWFIISLVDQPVVPTKKRPVKKAPAAKAGAAS